MTVAVRPAAPDDLDRVAALFDEYRQFQGQPSAPAAARAYLQQRAQRGESVVFVALDGGTPAGFAQLYPSFSSVALAPVFVLNDLFVRAPHRGRGVASRLLQAVEQHAWTHGAARLTLNVARTNDAGIALYDARGWVRDAQFFMYHRYPPG